MEKRIVFIQATWHKDIVSQSWAGFLSEIVEHGYAADHVERFEVPGAFEIPLLAKRIALTGRYDAIVGAALVVNGGIYRHEFVAQAVVNGLMTVQLDTDVPVFSVVLTPLNLHEHEEHVEFFTKHLFVKGEEAARACIGAMGQLDRVASLT